MLADWVIILLAVAVLWVLWRVFNLTADLFAYWYAAHEREAMQKTKGKGSSLS